MADNFRRWKPPYPPNRPAPPSPPHEPGYGPPPWSPHGPGYRPSPEPPHRPTPPPPPYPFIPRPTPFCSRCKQNQIHGVEEQDTSAMSSSPFYPMAYEDYAQSYPEDMYQSWYPLEALLWDNQDGMAQRVNEQMERDRMYFMELYPAQWKELQQRVEEVIDALDYPGSPIYDEYPDRMRMYGLIDGIYNQLMKEFADSQNTNNNMNSNNDLAMWSDKDCLRTSIQILLYQEIFYRRMRRM